MATAKLILDYVYDHEAAHPDKVLLTQPLGGGPVADYTWAQTLDQARRMAAHLKSRGFEPGARIAMLSKNCAHFFMTELAIWMAGYTTVAIFPTETGETVRYVLEHSEASLLFVGKLDIWPQQAPRRCPPACPASPSHSPRRRTSRPGTPSSRERRRSPAARRAGRRPGDDDLHLRLDRSHPRA